MTYENHQNYQKDENKSESESLGQYLSRTRLKKEIDLKSIAIKTKVNYNVLVNLEKDNLQRLPSRTYLRGFVCSFTKEIKGNEEYALNLLDKALKEHEREKTQDISTETYPSPNKEKEKSYNSTKPSPTKYALSAFAALTLLGISTFLIKKKKMNPHEGVLKEREAPKKIATPSLNPLPNKTP